MTTRNFSLILGIIFLVVGIAGFLGGAMPGLMEPLHDGHPAAMGTNGNLLGLFPVNELHNGAHILFGLWGIWAYRSGGSTMYCRIVAIAYGLLTVMGLVPSLNTAMGLMPLYGNDVWLHGAIALLAAYFGWVARGDATA